MENEILNILEKNEINPSIISYYISITEKNFINSQGKNEIILTNIGQKYKTFFLELIDYKMDFNFKKPYEYPRDYKWFIQSINDFFHFEKNNFSRC